MGMGYLVVAGIIATVLVVRFARGNTEWPGLVWGLVLAGFIALHAFGPFFPGSSVSSSGSYVERYSIFAHSD